MSGDPGFYWADVRYALRTIHQRPGLAAAAVLTLALGIGAATAVFSVVNAVLLKPLPYREPGRLVAIWITSTREEGLAKIFGTHADYAEFRRSSRTVEEVSAATWAVHTGRILTGVGPAREIMTVPASISFFDMLGVSAAIGRTFQPADEKRGCVMVLSHALWSTALGGDRAIVGRSLTLDDQACMVSGVMPARFGFYPRETEAWVLMGPGFEVNQDRLMTGIFARLKPGVTREQAQSELRTLYRAMHPGPEKRDFEPVVYDLGGEFTFLAGRTLRSTLVLVFAAVLLVLLIACLNVANLLLARMSERRREFAVRAALGSGQLRLVRQLFTENLVLSVLAGIAGVVVAYAGVRYFQYANPIELTVGANVQLSVPVLAFGMALSLATTLIFGLLPAVRASRVDFTQDLKTAGRGSIAGGYRFSKALIGVETALSFMLLTGAGLLMTSALRMGSEQLGFRPENILATRVALPGSRYANDAQRRRAWQELLDSIRRLPGASGAALASKLPPEAGGNQTLQVLGRVVPTGSEIHDIGADAVSPEFFDVLQMRLVQGRGFGVHDNENSQPVAIVNEALAHKYFPGNNPLGQQIRITGGIPWLTVVGVVGNLKHTQLMNEMSWVETPILYRPARQEPRQAMQIAIRYTGSPQALEREIPLGIARLDTAIPIHQVETLDARLGKTLAYPRFRATVLGLFAFGALLLSAVGLHGVLSQLVTRRVPEYGIRRALGAQTADLLLLVARHGGVPVIAGLIAGAGLTLEFRSLLANLVYGIEPTDMGALAGVGILLLGVACLATLAPALRAARVDPMAALRDE